MGEWLVREKRGRDGRDSTGWRGRLSKLLYEPLLLRGI
jgi:hypothetical protein